MKKTLGVIPARMASSRFPGKPLKKILGIPMLAHCYERAMLSEACDKLVIATPDQAIIDWADKYNIPSLLTSNTHERATERAQEASEILRGQGENYEFILLLQGDEPQIFPEDIKNLSSAFHRNNFEIVNLVYLIDGDDLSNQNVVKAIVSLESKIIFLLDRMFPIKVLRQ